MLLFVLAVALLSSPAAGSRHPCSPASGGGAAHHRDCPPFRSPLTFPFSSLPGCGHPSFQINCSSPHSVLSINRHPFQLLEFHPSNQSLLLNATTTAPINLSATPFRRASHSSTASSGRSAATTVLSWDSTADAYFSRCASCIGFCGFNDSSPSKPFLCFPYLDQRARHSPPSRVLILVSAGCVFVLIISLSAAAILRHRRDQSLAADADFIRRHQLRPPIFTYAQLRSATRGFDPRRKIGDGGFGSVYLAHLDGGRPAAVKRLHRRHPASFCNEVMILSSLRHPNLVRLHGYCPDPRGLLLVYDYVPNGTLSDHLHRFTAPPLAWRCRVDAALQTAMALEYLHFELKPPVVHRDVTSANIFVELDMGIKLGDFGLSRQLELSEPGDESSAYVRCTGPQGTPGYLDPDYHRSFRLTEKSDVYSFGVVLMELVTGMRAVDMKRDKQDVALANCVVARIQARELHRVVDSALVKQEGVAVMATVEAVAELAFRCVAEDKDDRPDARELVAELRRIRGQLQDSANGR